MAATESAIAAQLIERLLADPAFRDRFRRDPAQACREAGLDGLAEEMTLSAGKAMHTLDLRESRSSLAGVLMAAAMEGMGLYEFSKHVVPQIGELSGTVGDVLSRVGLPSLPGGGSLAAAPPATAPPPGVAESAGVGGGSSLPDGPAVGAEAVPAGGGSRLPADQVRVTAAEGPEVKAPKPAEPAAAPAAPPPPASAEAPAAPAAPEPALAARREPIDPGQFGQTGTGGKPDPEALALLKNKNVVLDDVGVADIKAGRIDPRIVGVLTKLSQEHKITVSCMCSDHSKFTAGGSISNHAYGRGLDIAAIDGEIVGPGSPLAREISSELSQLDAPIRPDEIGSPFAISGPGYFTDAAHQNHIHVGFKTEITPGFKLPTELRADQPAAAASPAPAAAGAPAPPGTAAPAPPEPRHDSGLFGAIAPAAAPTKTAAASDSQLFLGAVEKDQPPPAAQPPAAPAAAPAADLGAVGNAYPGDDAPREQIAAWMGKQAQKRGLPPQLPVMASLVESGLKNLNFGDADSVGFFQMRLSIWNQGDYAGYPDDPHKQLDWFLDTAQAVKAQRQSRGQSVTDPQQFGEWIADIERPAEQYRGRYQLQLDEANSLLKNAPPPPAPPEQVADAAAPPTLAKGPGEQAQAALAEARKYMGTPYKWGGSTPQTGFDCSGLVQWAYAQAGIKIPRVTDQQILATNGTAVKRSELLPGDLVFFRDASGYVHHVGMSLGGDKFVHAPHTGDVVKITSITSGYYGSAFRGGVRPG